MLRLLDDRTGSCVEVTPARPGLLRVCAHVRAHAEAADITGLRVLLVADLLFRTAELRKLQVLTVLASEGQPSGQLAVLERIADTLGIHPATAHASSGEAAAALGGPIDVHMVSNGAVAADRLSGLVVPVGAARIHRTGEATEDLLAGYEPVTVRLALLSFSYHQPAALTEGALADAHATARHWRLRVAEWAESPSRPVPKQIAEKANEAFDDLDTVSALGLLTDVASDADVPAGAKFETFLYADRILGLELPRDIGRPVR